MSLSMYFVILHCAPANSLVRLEICQLEVEKPQRLVHPGGAASFSLADSWLFAKFSVAGRLCRWICCHPTSEMSSLAACGCSSSSFTHVVAREANSGCPASSTAVPHARHGRWLGAMNTACGSNRPKLTWTYLKFRGINSRLCKIRESADGFCTEEETESFIFKLLGPKAGGAFSH